MAERDDKKETWVYAYSRKAGGSVWVKLDIRNVIGRPIIMNDGELCDIVAVHIKEEEPEWPYDTTPH